jgi:hypothetical protein
LAIEILSCWLLISMFAVENQEAFNQQRNNGMEFIASSEHVIFFDKS